MTREPAASVAEQILSEFRTVMSHQRHKWAALCQAYGLSMLHFQLLTILDADGPTAMSRLAERLNVGFSNVTGIVGRLEERGVVQRVHDATDRRIVLAQLTAAGDEMLRNVEEARLGHMRRLVETMSADERQTVLDALRTLSTARQRLDATHEEDRNASAATSRDRELRPA